jgi:hypothetical protein
LSQEYAPVVKDKPLLLAEYGFATGAEDIDSVDQTGIHLHNGLWATLFSGHAGSGMYWWWDTYIEPLDLWDHYEALSNFLESIDPAELMPGIATIQTSEGKTVGAEGLILKGENHLLLWVRSNQYTATAANDAYNDAVRNALRNKQKLDTFVYTPTPVSGHTVEFADVEGVEFEVRWYDPQTGRWGKVKRVEAVEGTLRIPLPTFRRDIAAEIKPAP